MKLAAAQTNRIKVQSAVKSDKSSCYQLSLWPKADLFHMEHHRKERLTCLETPFLISSPHMVLSASVPLWAGRVGGWLLFDETWMPLPSLVCMGRLCLRDQSSHLVPVILHRFLPASLLLDQPQLGLLFTKLPVGLSLEINWVVMQCSEHVLKCKSGIFSSSDTIQKIPPLKNTMTANV